MADHMRFIVATHVKVYFVICKAHWQREHKLAPQTVFTKGDLPLVLFAGQSQRCRQAA